MKSYDELHAMMYAYHRTHLYMYMKFSEEYPNLFNKHVTFVVRPADSKTDYYVPPALENKCIIIEKSEWTEDGCRLVGCFSFRENLEPCTDTDPPQWIKLGHDDYTLACQTACKQDLLWDTDYRDGVCRIANTHKKIFAMRPEEYNGVVAKQARLDIDKKGHLTLTKSYCDAYVLSFHEGDCYLSTGQMIAEAIIGTTVLRGLYEPDVEFPTPKPSVPDDFESAWTAKKTSKTKRNILDIKNKIKWYALEDSTDDDSDNETEEGGNGFIHFPNTPFDLSEFAKQLAIEIAVDFGIHVSLNIIEKQLEKYAIPAIQRIAVNAAMKRAVVHGIVKRVSAQAVATAAAAGASKALKFGFGALKTSTTIFNVISFFLDIFDPYEYNKVLTKEHVSAIDRLIDLRYFGTDQLETGTLLTPELIWDALKTKRQT